MMRKKIFFLFGLCLFFTAPQSFAWDASGHMLIAEIANENLSAAATRKLNQYINLFQEDNPRYRNILALSHYADDLRYQNQNAYNPWHFINIMFSNDQTALPKISAQQNLVWALHFCEKQIRNPNLNAKQKAFYLAMFIHLVGDAHQPMHCVSLVNHRFPKGDAGGNFYPIEMERVQNLHTLWDRGAGYFNERFHNKTLRYWQVHVLAQQIKASYPKNYFGDKIKNLDPMQWAKESFVLAKNFAYQTPPGKKPTRQYIKKARVLTQQQIGLAGYRLAFWLNENLK